VHHTADSRMRATRLPLAASLVLTLDLIDAR
jgi:hypothetical protein